MDRRIAELEEQVEKLTEVADGLVDMNAMQTDLNKIVGDDFSRRIKSLERFRIITNLTLLVIVLGTLYLRML